MVSSVIFLTKHILNTVNRIRMQVLPRNLNVSFFHRSKAKCTGMKYGIPKDHHIMMIM